jgi:hypothetical protein
MTSDQTVEPSSEWLARIAQSLKLGADRHGIAQVPVELAGRMLVALSTARDRVSPDDVRRMVAEEAEHVARLLLDAHGSDDNLCRSCARGSASCA